MILSIQTGKENNILRRKAQEIKNITAEIKQLALDMTETLEAKNGMGLAAPQVDQSLRLIITKPAPDKTAIAIINPEIIKSSRKKDVLEEGCLSVPDIYLPIERSAKITVIGLDINGQSLKIKAEGLLSRVIQHEINHLDGILITDKKL